MDFVFFDCETGGLDPKTCTLTQVAAVKATAWQNGDVDISAPVNLLIKPVEGKELSQRALQVQGRTPEQVMAHPLTTWEAIQQLRDWYQQYAPGLPCYAWYAPFDAGFIENNLCGSLHMKHASFLGNFLPRDARDARAIAQLLIDMGLMPVKGSSLQTVARHFGLAQAEPHDALSDAVLGAQVLARMLGLLRGGRE